jgi:hypothetical protein
MPNWNWNGTMASSFLKYGMPYFRAPQFSVVIALCLVASIRQSVVSIRPLHSGSQGGIDVLSRETFEPILKYNSSYVVTNVPSVHDNKLEARPLFLNKKLDLDDIEPEARSQDLKNQLSTSQSQQLEIYFSLNDVARHLIDALHATLKRDKIDRALSITVVNKAQICLLDNFIAHLGMLSSAFPPLVVFCLDQESFHVCCALKRLTQYDHLWIRCASPHSSAPVSPATVLFGDSNYRSAVWMKPLLLEISLATNVTVLITDIDIVFLKSPRWNAVKSAQFQMACEVPGDRGSANTGFIVATPKARAAVTEWTRIARFPPSIDDQSAFRQRIARINPEWVKCLPSEQFRMGCKCNSDLKEACGDKVVAVHCTLSPNKPDSLLRASLWHPIITSHENCSFGVPQSWWNSHPKTRRGALPSRQP